MKSFLLEQSFGGFHGSSLFSCLLMRWHASLLSVRLWEHPNCTKMDAPLNLGIQTSRKCMKMWEHREDSNPETTEMMRLRHPKSKPGPHLDLNRKRPVLASTSTSAGLSHMIWRVKNGNMPFLSNIYPCLRSRKKGWQSMTFLSINRFVTRMSRRKSCAWKLA